MDSKKGENLVFRSLKSNHILTWLSGVQTLSLLFYFYLNFLDFQGKFILNFSDFLKNIFSSNRFNIFLFIAKIDKKYAYIQIPLVWVSIIIPSVLIIIYLLMHFIFLKKSSTKGILISFSILACVHIFNMVIISQSFIKYMQSVKDKTGFLTSIDMELLGIFLLNLMQGILFLLFYITNGIVMFKSKISNKYYITYLIALIGTFTIGITVFLYDFILLVYREVLFQRPSLYRYPFINSVISFLIIVTFAIMVYGFIKEIDIIKGEEGDSI